MQQRRKVVHTAIAVPNSAYRQRLLLPLLFFSVGICHGACGGGRVAADQVTLNLPSTCDTGLTK